jgi:hypothetical protein
LFGLTRRDVYDRLKKVASFNHNYHVRQPEDFALFTAMNNQLSAVGESQVFNYGGNIRAMGADIRYSGAGPTGNYTTLSPFDCLKEIMSLSAIVHFKSTVWGGGVFFHALHTSTPIITTKRYVDASNSSEYLIHGHNCIIIENQSDSARAVIQVMNDKSFRDHLIDGMIEMKQKIFSDEYWNVWKSFIDDGVTK